MRRRAACSPSGRVIGILGCEPGVGVTHLSVTIANYIGSKLKQKVLLVELNRQDAFLEIQKSYEGVEDEALLSRRFTLYDADYCRDVLPGEMASILNEPYGYFVIDMGSEWRENKDEFLRSDRKLLLGSLAEWRRKQFVTAAEELRRAGSGIMGMAFLGLEEDTKYFGKKYGMDLVPVPVIRDPFALTRQQFAFLQTVI